MTSLSFSLQMPGPPVAVCAGDRVIVDVRNHLPTESFSVHWHGEHMRDGRQHMDGTPHVTQCPINPGARYTQFRKWKRKEKKAYYCFFFSLQVQVLLCGQYSRDSLLALPPCLPEGGRSLWGFHRQGAEVRSHQNWLFLPGHCAHE